MKRSLINGLAASALVLSAMTANAADELVIYVFKDGQAASDLVVRLDGQEEQAIGSAGSVAFDLSAGGHSIQILRDGQTVHSFRFDTALGQLTDINVALSDSGRPKVAVESFFKTETASERAKAPKGVLSGRVVSGGAPVEGALIEVDGENYSTVSGADGSYQLELPRGEYQLTISHPDMRLVETEARVVSNVTRGLNLTMRAKQGAPSIDIAMPQIEEVTVLATFDPNAFEADERFSSNVIDTIGIEQLARFGDSDVSASVVRLPSVTVQDDSFIFIRGLGGRYVTTTLNNSTMPSTNPNRRSVPLDLFPSNIVSQLDVKKTFLPHMPGESTGGNLVINTRTFPDEGAGKFSVKLGYLDGITGSTVASDPSEGDFDYIGFDDGSRREPIAVEAIATLLNPALALGLDPSAFADQDDPFSAETEVRVRQAAGFFLTDDLDLDERTATPDFGFSANYGDLFYLGGYEIGYFGALNYKTGYSQRSDGISRSYSVAGDQVLDDFDFEENIFQVNASGLLSFGMNAGNSSFESNTILSRVTENTVRVSDGREGDSFEDSFQYTIEWVERQYASQQFVGEHFITDSFTADWQTTASQTTRYAPDRREVQFNIKSVGEPFTLETSETIRRYDELEEYNYDLSNNFEWLITSNGNFDQTLSFGWQYVYRERDAESSTYGFRYGGDDNTFVFAPNTLASDVINDDNVTGLASTGLEFTDRTQPSDSYESDLTQTAFYFTYDALINSEFQIVLGARLEDFELETDTFELTGEQLPTTASVEEESLLPALALNWYYSESQQIRFAVSETVSRPDFKEASNAVFYDNEFNFRVRGNPDLEVGTVFNADLRWEYYWGDTENLSVALFYKDFTDPIERVILAASGTAGNSRTFENSESGEISGIEVDTRIDFPLNDALSRNIFLTGNVSLIDSEVVSQGNTSKLQGAPEYTFNLVVGYDDLENNQEFTLLFNQNGDTVVDRGLDGRADIVAEPVANLNLNYKKSFENEMAFSAKFSNLLDAETEFTQDGQVFQSFRRGVEVEVGLDWNF